MARIEQLVTSPPSNLSPPRTEREREREDCTFTFTFSRPFLSKTSSSPSIFISSLENRRNINKEAEFRYLNV